jgi:hypothetical protein
MMQDAVSFRSIRVWGCFVDFARGSDGGCSIRLSVVITSLLRSQEQIYGKKIPEASLQWVFYSHSSQFYASAT